MNLSGPRANFTESDAVAQDRKLVQGLAGLLGLQQAKYSIGVRSKLDETLLKFDAAREERRKKRRNKLRGQRRKKKVQVEDVFGKEHKEPELSREEKLKRTELVQREQDDEAKKYFYKRHLTCKSKERYIQKVKIEESKNAGTYFSVSDSGSKTGTEGEGLAGTNSVLLQALRELESVIWQGTGFPELHEMAAKAVSSLIY